MPKRKRPITDAGYLAPNSSSTPRSSRALIRQFHILLKRQAQLKSQQQDVATASALVDVEREIEKLGGLGAYQRMSAIGQGNDRGGGSERVLIGWLMDMSVSNREGKGKLRYSNHRRLIAARQKSHPAQITGSWRAQARQLSILHLLDRVHTCGFTVAPPIYQRARFSTHGRSNRTF
jgi:hypothetical protein